MVIGGFGGIGRSVCRWLAEQGARHLVVVSRSAGSTEKIRQLRAELGDVPHNVELSAIRCDISDKSQLRTALDGHAQTGAPAIKGIIHCGMELKVILLCLFDLTIANNLQRIRSWSI